MAVPDPLADCWADVAPDLGQLPAGLRASQLIHPSSALMTKGLPKESCIWHPAQMHALLASEESATGADDCAGGRPRQIEDRSCVPWSNPRQAGELLGAGARASIASTPDCPPFPILADELAPFSLAVVSLTETAVRL